MALLGHKTTSIFLRYKINSDADLLDGGAKLAEFFDKSVEPAEQVVVQLKQKTGTE